MEALESLGSYTQQEIQDRTSKFRDKLVKVHVHVLHVYQPYMYRVCIKKSNLLKRNCAVAKHLHVLPCPGTVDSVEYKRKKRVQYSECGVL